VGAEAVSPILNKTNGSRLFTETLSAKVESVLANKTGLVGTVTALTAAFTIFSGTREPNCIVSHIGLLDEKLLVLK